MNIGEVIKYMRQKRNMTQAELAAVLNVTPQAVSRWEMDISYPDIAMLPRISETLLVSADELLGIRPQWKARTQTGNGMQPELMSEQDTDPLLNQSQADSVFDYVPEPVTGKGKKILVTDDADFMRMILTDILTSKGHTVLQARNGQECLDILRKETVDVCLLDIVMPVMDGMDALRQMKKGNPEIKVIMVSALARESVVKQALQLGADAFVVKPFHETCLIERIG